MKDKTTCSGEGCRVKDKCKRFPINKDLGEIYFLEPPLEVIDNVLVCKMFWGENSDKIYKSILEIFNSKQ